MSGESVLFLTGRLPFPLDDGWKIRTFNLMKGLCRSGYTIDLVSFADEGEAVEPLREVCRTVRTVLRKRKYTPVDLMKGIAGVQPFSVINYYDPEMKSLFNGTVTENGYDFIQVEDVVMAQYLSKNVSIRFLDMHNIESNLLVRYARQEKNLLKKIYAWQTAHKLSVYERRIADRFHGIFVCSDEDASMVISDRRNRVHIIPNGVDTGFFTPGSGEEADTIVFVGSMDYHANISGIRHFVREIFPSVTARHPGVTLEIVGKNPTAEVTALAGPNIVVTGSVPDVRPYLTRAKVVIAPLLVGGGTRLKILEAMAMGKAVVSTPVGAEGIPAVDGHSILLAESSPQFIQKLHEILDGGPKRREIGMNARQFVTATFSWEKISFLLCNAYGQRERVAP